MNIVSFYFFSDLKKLHQLFDLLDAKDKFLIFFLIAIFLKNIYKIYHPY